jgi:hypothetical protein
VHDRHVKVPDEAELANSTSWAREVFATASNTVIHGKPFPVAFRNPDPSGPENLWLMPNGVSHARMKSGHGVNWNLETGKPRGMEELISIYKERHADPESVSAINAARTAVAANNTVLSAVNGNLRHPKRLRLASGAVVAFVYYFSAATGINESVLINLENSDELEEDIRARRLDRATYKQLKLRGGAKEIAATVRRGLMVDFRLYLELRSYVLNGRRSKALFLMVSEKNKLQQLTSGQVVIKIRSMAKFFNLQFRTANTKELRAAKQDHVVSRMPPSIAAGLMSHSLKVASLSYTNGVTAVNVRTMGNFLDNVDHIVARSANRPSSSVSSAIGACKKYGEPVAERDTVPIKPTCNQLEGCLFCNKYKVYMDEKDVRKVLSCRAYLKMIDGANSDAGYARDVLRPTLRRIAGILKKMRCINPALVRSVGIEVDREGLLEEFWQNKIDQLIILGVICPA